MKYQDLQEERVRIEMGLYLTLWRVKRAGRNGDFLSLDS